MKCILKTILLILIALLLWYLAYNDYINNQKNKIELQYISSQIKSINDKLNEWFIIDNN